MPSVDSYDASVTSIEFPWPKEITPIERIMLSASGDLQRLLSAFFARPITVAPTFAQTSPPYNPSPLSLGESFDESSRVSSAAAALSPSSSRPTMQRRQVHLLCNANAGQVPQQRTVCVATSKVTITNPQCARLFLKEKYAIGQIFRKMGVVPSFVLQDVGILREEVENENRERDIVGEKNCLALDFGDEKPAGYWEGSANGNSWRGTRKKYVEARIEKLWRRYTLEIAGFSAEIIEVFPDRSMFVLGEAWLDGSPEALPTVPIIAGLPQQQHSLQYLPVPQDHFDLDDRSACTTSLSLSPTETLVQEGSMPFHVSRPASRAESSYSSLNSGNMPPVVKSAETWAETNGLLRFMAVFIAVLLLFNLPREGGGSYASSDEIIPGYSLGSLMTKVLRLLDIQGSVEE